jgi:DNA-binding SARP family transcriptional activator/uncharacterized membrane protein YgcG
MEFRVLGPLEVRSPSGVVPVPGARPRTILAVLLLHANEPVSAERLAEALFGSETTANAVANVRVHVSRLRRLLGEDGERIVTTPAGYQLRVEAGALDSARFAQGLERGREALATDPRAAAAHLDEALALWRGRPLADLEFVPFVQPAIARLEEQRLTAIELRVEADLALDRADAVIAELQDLVQRHPLRERLHAQLMVAFYRCGRQADALDVYRRLRTTLMEELGIEPSPELRDLETAILRHEPSLGDGRRVRRAPSRRPSRRVAALMALGTVAGVVTGMLALGGSDSPNAGDASALGTSTSPPAAAVAVSDGVFAAQVAKVCDSVNASFRAQRRDDAHLRARLHRAHTTTAQREAILTAVRASLARGADNLADLNSLEVPAERQALLTQTAKRWDDNLDAMRAYALRLDRASSRRELLKAIAPFTNARPQMGRNSTAVKAGLQRLGAPKCRIGLYIARPILLPSLPRDPQPARRPDVVVPRTVLPPTPTVAPRRSAPDLAAPTGGGPDIAPPTRGGGASSSGPDVAPKPSAGGGGGSSRPDVGSGGGGGGGGGLSGGGEG